MTRSNKKYKTVLTIAGFDGGGGAGIQADLKTFAALGCYGLTVLTALPIQNSCGIKKIYSIDAQCIKDQLQAILEDFEIDAIKIGMLDNEKVIDCISVALCSYTHLSIILDPVMIATSGEALISSDALDTMIESLFPLVTLLTPNLNEASTFLKRKIDTKQEMELAAVELSLLGPKAVLVKGGHLMHPTCDDCLYLPHAEETFQWFCSLRIASKNLHGTGCTFSSAIAAYLAQGHELMKATSLAKQYLFNAVESGASFQLGHGQGPVHHFFASWAAEK